MTKVDLEKCIEKYGTEIYSFCRYLTGSTQEGEELYQDTFLKAMEILDKLDEEKNPKGYLLSTAIKLWKNKHRKYAWRKRIVNMESLEEIIENHGEPLDIQAKQKLPEEKVLATEQVIFVQDIVSSLPEKYRLILYLYFTVELSLKEISACLKVPEGTVKSRLYKAKQLVKKELEGTEYDR